MRKILALLALSLLPTVAAAQSPALRQLSRLAPDANPRVLSLALEAREFDLANNTLLFHEVVAHGQGTGENMARAFSNIDGSHQTSLGLFRTGDTYQGGNGYSMRMEGLEPGTNDKAMSRAIVMHGAPYVNVQTARKQGRLGRSWGCPAVRPEVARQVIDSLKNGQMIFSYYPDTNWLAKSPFIKCRDKQQLAGVGSPRVLAAQ